jgi:hypothetical protein
MGLYALYTQNAQSEQGMSDRPFHLSRIVLAYCRVGFAYCRVGLAYCRVGWLEGVKGLFFPASLGQSGTRGHETSGMEPLGGVPLSLVLDERGQVVCSCGSTFDVSSVAPGTFAPVPVFATGASLFAPIAPPMIPTSVRHNGRVQTGQLSRPGSSLSGGLQAVMDRHSWLGGIGQRPWRIPDDDFQEGST